MKPILITIAFLMILSLTAKAQNSDTSKRTATDTTIYTFVLHAPSFPGGDKGFIRFLVKQSVTRLRV